MRCWSAALGVCLILAACGSEDPVFVEPLEATVVYGADDRLEVHEHPDEGLRRLAQESLVAQVPWWGVEELPGGVRRLSSDGTLADRGVCPDEAFADQVRSNAICSGVLIADDLVLTAGHCVESQRDCEAYFYVFNHHLEAEDTAALVLESDVYSCRELVLREFALMGNVPDYAVIQLDRPVTPDHVPAAIRPATPLEVGDPVAMIGSPNGLPAKIDSGARVASVSGEAYVTNVDAFQGHSGSPVFDGEDRLSGVLVVGRTDFVEQPGEDCLRVNTLADAEAGEYVQNIASVIAALCEAGEGDETLCDEKACDGQPCGAPPSPVPSDDDEPAGVVAANAGGCSVSSGSDAPSFAALLLVVWVAATRVRRKVA